MENKFWYKTCIGKSGKNVHLVSESFWNWIEKERHRTKCKRNLARAIEKISYGHFKSRMTDSWLYNNKKPIIIKDDEILKVNKNLKDCIHGQKHFCPSCKLYERVTKGSPVQNIWISDKSGKLYIYDKFWDELIFTLKNCFKIGVLPQKIAEITAIDQRTLRKYSHEDLTPTLYTQHEFRFTPENTYWTGLFLSDGHLRNNGSNSSYTYQVGSSNPFQGYWYVQFIQKFLQIFKNKREISKTYLCKHTRNKWAFKTNLSSFSPIFAKFLEENKVISKRNITKTSGYQKNISQSLFDSISNKDALFQGLFDGDGHASINRNNSIALSLATEHLFKHNILINNLDLVPTLCRDKRKLSLIYHEDLNNLEEIRFAPASLVNLSPRYTAKDIAQQLAFMIKGAGNSIRPDKVHTLIKIAERVKSKDYGEYRHCLEVQREIKKELNKLNIEEDIKNLKRNYPIKDDRYQPFIPGWAKELGSKKNWINEYWDFFLNHENLFIKEGYSKKIDFSNGVPIDFKL